MAKADVWKNLGDQKYEDEDFEGAISAYQNALAISETPVILSNLFKIYIKLNRFGKALEVAERVSLIRTMSRVDIDWRRRTICSVRTQRPSTYYAR